MTQESGKARERGGRSGRGSPMIAVFLSGGGRTLENLLCQIGAGRLDAIVGLVVASKACRGAEIARAAGIETVVVPTFATADEVGVFLGSRDVEWVVLAGYVKYLPIPERYGGYVVNIHPSLLPKFGGKGMYGERVHDAVINAGETETGCTVHLVDGAYDSGRVLAQERCAVEPGDTPASLGARVFELEKRLYPEVLRSLFAGERVSQRGETQ